MSKQKYLLLIVFAITVCSALNVRGQDATQATSKAICTAAFTLPAHDAKTCTFSVPERSGRMRLEGKFTATGGSRNSIEVWVMNDDQFVNWTNHHPLTALYQSHRVTQGTVRLLLPSEGGTYHVVFNNEFSILTPKAVEASFFLRSLN
jgi:hypothetical protein